MFVCVCVGTGGFLKYGVIHQRNVHINFFLRNYYVAASSYDNVPSACCMVTALYVFCIF